MNARAAAVGQISAPADFAYDLPAYTLHRDADKRPQDSEIRTIIVYLRSLAPPRNITVPGDPVKGKKIFFGDVDCSTCHCGGVGGVLEAGSCRAWARRVRFLT